MLMPHFYAMLEHWRDGLVRERPDPGLDSLVEAGLHWLCRAQDRSRSADGGVARHYSLIRGWGPSYPETTGYIVSTLLECAADYPEMGLPERARRMLDWLVELQHEDGSFPGGTVDDQPARPVTFNTGQILLGLCTGVQVFGDAYRDALVRAADWLVETQDADGCWRRFQSPFTLPGEKTYETHVAWALIEAERLAPGRGYAEAAHRNARWAITHQRGNGWLDHCCLNHPEKPLTHTIGYALRGLLEVHAFTDDPVLLEAAVALAEGVRGALPASGRLAGQLDSGWEPAAAWSCLTGNVQIAYCWLQLHALDGDPRWLEAACLANRFVRTTVRVKDVSEDVRGAVKGSVPVSGGYTRWEYPAWATKFAIDAHRYERRLTGEIDCVPASR